MNDEEKEFYAMAIFLGVVIVGFMVSMVVVMG